MALRSGLRHFCSSRATATADLRAIRDEHVARARDRIFGPQGDMPGDRYFRKNLEGSELMRWYFPSKYGLQDFRIDDYFEMQAERHAPRDVHRCIPMLTELLERASGRREELRSLFQKLDEATFMKNPTLQDLYGVFRLVDPDPALKFDPPPSIWREHAPLYSQAPPFRAFVDDAPKKGRHAASQATLHGSTSDAAELRVLFLALKAKLGDGASTLEARVTLLRSLEHVREVLLEEAQRLGVVVPFEDVTVIVEEPQQKQKLHGPASSESSAETKANAAGAERTAKITAGGVETNTEANAADAKGNAEAKDPCTEGTSEAIPHPEDDATAKTDVGRYLIGSWRYGKNGSFDITSTESGLHLETRLSKRSTLSGVLVPTFNDNDSNTSWFEVGLGEIDVRLKHEDEDGTVAFQIRRDGAVDWAEEMRATMKPRPDMEEKLSKNQGSEAVQTGVEQTDAVEPRETGPSTTMTNHETSQNGDVDVPAVTGDTSQHGGHSNEPTRMSQVRLVAYAARPRLGGDAAQRNATRARAEKRLAGFRKQDSTRGYLMRRHRFIDPMYRRRRLKWLERYMAQQHSETQIKFRNYYAPHPDDVKEWPSNKGSVTVEWPSPYH